MKVSTFFLGSSSLIVISSAFTLTTLSKCTKMEVKPIPSIAPNSFDNRKRQSLTQNGIFSEAQYYQSLDSSSSLVKEFSLYSQLEELTELASNPLPDRPDGIVTIAKFSSLERKECRETEPEYERLSRLHPDTLFLRCYEEFEDANLLMSQAKVMALPTFDIFYKNKRVGRVEGNEITEVEEYIKRYGFINTKLDLFSEEAQNREQLKWGDGAPIDYSRTPRTTARFVPGYDWNTKKGFFDAQADKAMEDFEGMYENWTPKIDDK